MFPFALVCCWLVGAGVARVNLSMDLSGGLVRCRFLVILCRSAFKVRRSVEYESSFDESCKQKINHRKCQVDTKWISHESILAMLYGINRMFACDRLFVCANINLICCGASEEKREKNFGGNLPSSFRWCAFRQHWWLKFQSSAPCFDSHVSLN